MTPQELEDAIAHARSIPKGFYDFAELGESLLPALLDLWRAAEEAEQADRIVKMARCATAADYAPLLKRLQDARKERRAALARLREVRL